MSWAFFAQRSPAFDSYGWLSWAFSACFCSIAPSRVVGGGGGSCLAAGCDACVVAGPASCAAARDGAISAPAASAQIQTPETLIRPTLPDRSNRSATQAPRASRRRAGQGSISRKAGPATRSRGGPRRRAGQSFLLPARAERAINLDERRELGLLRLREADFGREEARVGVEDLQVAGGAAAIADVREASRVLGRGGELFELHARRARPGVPHERVGHFAEGLLHRARVDDGRLL